MPEIVQQYAANRDLVSLKPIYNTLLIAYQDDVQKYASGKVRVEIMEPLVKNTPGGAVVTQV